MGRGAAFVTTKDDVLLGRITRIDYNLFMKTTELLKALRKLGATEDRNHGKGGHITVILHGKTAVVPTAKGEIATGTLASILRSLGLTKRDITQGRK